MIGEKLKTSEHEVRSFSLKTREVSPMEWELILEFDQSGTSFAIPVKGAVNIIEGVSESLMDILKEGQKNAGAN